MKQHDSSLVLHCPSSAVKILASAQEPNVVANYVQALTAFTARMITGNKVESRRIAIIVAVDKEMIKAPGEEIPVDAALVEAMLEKFFEMVVQMVGPGGMQQILERRHHMAMESLVDDVMGDIGFDHENLN